MEDIRQLFPARLKALRDSRGLSQTAFARSIGLSLPTYTRYESGERVPDLIMLGMICHATDCSPLYLMGYSSSVKDENIDAVERLGLSESAIEILHNELSDCFTAPFLSALITDPDFMAMVIYAENSMIFRTHEAEGIDPQCAPIALDASARRYSRMVERMDAESLTANVYDEGEDNIDRIRKNAEKYMLL